MKRRSGWTRCLSLALLTLSTACATGPSEPFPFCPVQLQVYSPELLNQAADELEADRRPACARQAAGPGCDPLKTLVTDYGYERDQLRAVPAP